MTAKQLLTQITNQAYDAGSITDQLGESGFDMSLLTGVRTWAWDSRANKAVRSPEMDMTDDVAQRIAGFGGGDIVAILGHVAWVKETYIGQAFGSPPEAFLADTGTLESMLMRLDVAQSYLTACLRQMPDEKLPDAVAARYYGGSAANLFLVLAQHDVYHGGQICLIRNEHESRRTDSGP